MKTIVDIYKSFEGDSVLNENDMRFIQLRFGIGVIRSSPPKKLARHENVPIGSNGHTLEEMAQFFKLTKIQTRYLEGKVLRRLRHPARFKKILAALQETPSSEDAAMLVRIIYPGDNEYHESLGISLKKNPEPAGSPHRKRRHRGQELG